MIEQLARERLGFGQLRPGQLRAVEALADGRDALAVLPPAAGNRPSTNWPGCCGTGRPSSAEVPFAMGARVVSERWEQGTVQRYDGDQVTVLFDEHGYRELFVPVVLQRSLLRLA
jgi:hypothetical protein